jgi:hypothetical protein
MELVLKSRHSYKFTRKVQGPIEEEVRVLKVLLPEGVQPSLCSSESLGGTLAEF